MYQKHGYVLDGDPVKEYYSDKEDAYSMVKILTTFTSSSNFNYNNDIMIIMI